MRIFAIETSCDETAVALIEAGGSLNPSTGGRSASWRIKILKNLVASQIKIHQPYGGVVPNLAKREHLKNLPILFKKIQNTRYKIQDTDLIVVTVGPGLEPCLWTGINFVPTLLKILRGRDADRSVGAKKIPVIGVNHLEGHLYSFLLSYRDCFASLAMTKNIFPAVALIISGGHTILLLMKDLIHYKKLGETRDDAVGECFDKVARLLKLPYPGGPEIEKLAKRGNPNAVNFPRPMINQKNYDFSFSGLKTAVLYYLKNNENLPLRKVSRSPSGHGLSEARERGRESSGRASGWASETPSFREASLSDVAASFQAAAFEVLINKTLRAAKEYEAKSILVSGGVASNISLRKYLKLRIKNEKLRVNFFVPPKKFCGDNAAMIAAAGYINYLQHKNHRLLAQGNLNLK